jgi:hypothetical protein
MAKLTEIHRQQAGLESAEHRGAASELAGAKRSSPK